MYGNVSEWNRGHGHFFVVKDRNLFCNKNGHEYLLPKEGRTLGEIIEEKEYVAGLYFLEMNQSEKDWRLQGSDR